MAGAPGCRGGWNLSGQAGPSSALSRSSPGPGCFVCFLIPRCCTDSPTPPCSFSSRTPAQTAGIRSSDGLVSFTLRMRSRAGDGRGPWTHSGLRPVLRQQVHGPEAWEWGAGLFCTRVPPQCLGCGQHPRALHGGDRGSSSRPQISILFPGFLSQPQECLHGVRASGVPFPSFKPLSPLGLSAWNLCSDLTGSVPGCSSVWGGGGGGVVPICVRTQVCECG